MPLLTTRSARSFGLGSFSGISAIGAFYSISTLSGGTTIVSFTSIPQDYTHLQIRAVDYCSFAGTGLGEWYIRFNGDTTGANYYKQRYVGYSGANLLGQNASVGSEGIWGTPDNRASSIGFAGYTIDIHNYTSSTWKHMIARGGGGVDATSHAVGVAAGPWMSTSAINRIDIECNGGTFNATSKFALYGIK